EPDSGHEGGEEKLPGRPGLKKKNNDYSSAMRFRKRSSSSGGLLRLSPRLRLSILFYFLKAEDGIRDWSVTGVQTCALPIWPAGHHTAAHRQAAPAGTRSLSER